MYDVKFTMLTALTNRRLINFKLQISDLRGTITHFSCKRQASQQSVRLSVFLFSNQLNPFDFLQSVDNRLLMPTSLRKKLIMKTNSNFPNLPASRLFYTCLLLAGSISSLLLSPK
jgi:hypothetical protein